MAVFLVVGVSLTGWAQQTGTFRVKRSPPTHKAPKVSAPMAKPAATTNSSAKDLQNVERQSVKSTVPSKTAGKKSAGMASAPKLTKDKPNPPINFNGNGSGKSVGAVNQGANPYKGRLRQKHAHQ